MAKILYTAGTYGHIKCFHTDYIEALRAKGHQVLTMARGEEADFDIPFEKKMFSAKLFANRKRIRKILKEENFDAILLNTTLAALNVRLALGRKRPRVVNLVHGFMFSKSVKGIKEKIFLSVERFFKSKTDAIMVMNNDDLESAQKYALTSGETVMTRGMGAEIKAEAVSADEIRSSLSSESSYVICFVGELCGAKNQDILIRLIPKLKKDIPNIALWLPGAGKGEQELKSLAKELGVDDVVHFPGYVANPTDYVRAADLYVAPSKKEGLPFNVIEALGAAKPIIASDIKGHRDLIEDGVTGFLYNVNSPDELLIKIKAIHSGQTVLNTDAQTAVFRKYSKEEVFDETLGIMERLMEV